MTPGGAGRTAASHTFDPSVVVVPHKVHPPAPSGLRRARLENRVTDALHSSRHVLIVAPPGAGKTTLMSQVAAASGFDVAWYTAGAEEAHPTALVRYLARALNCSAEQALQPQASVDELLAALGEPGRPVSPQLLVIDDLHELVGSPAARALERFVECCPAHLHVLLGARRPPDFNAPRMMASGTLTPFDGDDLRFRSWEVEELFRELYREPLSPESAALLTRRVGGFAAALQLFHLSTRGRTRAEREAQIFELSGRSPLIRSYLARTVLDSLSADRRDFLLRTSVLDMLDATLCDSLLGRKDSACVLRELARDQLFTTTRDGIHHQYHQVLRNHLEITLEDERPAAEVVALHLRAAGLLEDAGYPRAALRAYQRAGDWGSAARLVRRTAEATPTADELGPLTDPAGNPWLALARARALLRQGSIEAGIAALDRLVQSVDDPDPELVRLCSNERLAASLWLPGPPRLPAATSSPLAALRALTQLPHAPVPELPAHSAAGRLWTVLSSLVTGEFTEARTLLDQAVRTPAEEPWIRLSLNLIDIVLCLAEPPEPTLAAARLDDLSLTAEVEGYPWLGRLARGLQTCVLLEETGLAWRSRLCEAVIDACVRDGDQWGELVLRIVLSVTLARLGRRGEAQAGFAYAQGLCHHLDAPGLERWVQGYLVALGVTDLQPAPSSGFVAHCAVSLRARPHRPLLAEPSASPRSNLQCLGGFRLSLGDVTTDLTPLRPRARLLLMRLAIDHGSDIHREQLIDALWPEADFTAGLRRLQVSVSSVRQLLEHAGWGTDCLVRSGNAYRLQLPEADVDVRLLEARVAEISRSRDAVRGSDDAWIARIELVADELLELYRGDLLPEVGPAEWVLPERDRLRLLTASALASVSRSGLAAGRPDLALVPARRLVEIDPLRDTAWLLLARIQRGLGDHNAADDTLAAYHRIGAELRGS